MPVHHQSRSRSGRRTFHTTPRFKHGGRRSFTAHPTSRRGAFTGQYIDPSKFVNKAQPIEAETSFIPERQFEDFAIHPSLKRAIKEKGYRTPTPIQDQVIPHILAGADVVGIANTGTGKTGAFLIPLIHALGAKTKKQVLILVPTRELALQIDTELKGLSRGMRLFSVCCVGGAPLGPQLSALRYPNQFIIGTPGRVKDLIERGKIKLAAFDTIVLDEADRMLDMGFVADMRFVMAGMPGNRHTLFFSATMSPEIDTLINEFLKSPVKISVKTRDTAENVEQDIVRVARGAHKFDVLCELLARPAFEKVLVFGRTKHGVEKLAKALVERGFKAESIHGNKTHSRRQRSLNLFKESRVRVLVATDVAARGLDINSISHVINYDLPMTYEDYVHRIGRTGRGEKRGVALTFIE